MRGHLTSLPPFCNILRMKVRLPLTLALALLAAGCSTPLMLSVRPLPKDAVPPVVAVTSFENRSGFAGEWKIGSGMADILVSELLACDNFVVVERTHLDNVVKELELQNDAMFRKEGRVDRGRLKNAQYLIRGVITDFSQVSGGGITVVIRKLFFGGKGYKARVSLALTIVDVESGQVVDSVQASGTARAREAYAKIKYKSVAFGGDRFFKTPLGVATSCAMRDALRGVVKKMPRIYWEPMIAEVTATHIIINGGKDRDIREGDLFNIQSGGKQVTDPRTGDVLETIAGPIVGTVRVTEIKPTISYATIVKGDDLKRGQRLLPVEK
jgi:curli biogenesis system outer membrane secretion channel CsgG